MGRPMSRSRHKKWDKFARALKDRHLRKNGAVCSRCKRVSGELECHHIVPIERDRARELDADNNIEILCRKCHIEHHQKPIPPDRAAWMELVRNV